MKKDLTRVVIIGRSSSGKTTLTKELEKRNYNVIHEVARGVLEERKNFIINNDEQFTRQKIIYERQKNLEDFSSGFIFHDRSLVDILGYIKYFEIDGSFINKEELKGRYNFVFELEKRPFISDGVRIESDECEADKIFSFVKQAYLNLEYNSILVPNFCEDKYKDSKTRTDFILNKLETKNV
jgi:predicted ATPase